MTGKTLTGRAVVRRGGGVNRHAQMRLQLPYLDRGLFCRICVRYATLDSDEPCDGLVLNNKECKDIVGEGSTGTLRCAPNCVSFDITGCSAASTCGNSVIEGGEKCDGAKLNDQTCATQVGAGSTGTLKCNSKCNGFDTSGCTASTARSSTTRRAQKSSGRGPKVRSYAEKIAAHSSPPGAPNPNSAVTARSTSKGSNAMERFSRSAPILARTILKFMSRARSHAQATVR